MRRVLALALPLCALALTATGTGGGAVSASCAKGDLAVVNDGKLTVGTDNPAYPPWYAGGTPKGSKWKINDPSTGKGFESAVAYAVGKQLGFSRTEVQWAYVPFAKSYAPGKKSFDFDINQISVTPQRAKVVDFSNSYYDVSQAIIVTRERRSRGRGRSPRSAATSSGSRSGRRATRRSSTRSSRARSRPSTTRTTRPCSP